MNRSNLNRPVMKPKTSNAINWKPLLASCLLTVAVSGCASMDHVRRTDSESPIVLGPSVTQNRTPLEGDFRCLSSRIRDQVDNHQVLYVRDHDARNLRVGVGQVRDYTGKFSELNGGSAITQGGALMVISALGKLSGAVRIFERFDTGVTDLELQYLTKRYLGDERKHSIQDGGAQQTVPWKPYMGGSVVETDYFIVGGITELNYNIFSGGAELLIDQIGPKARVFAVNVSADLRLVDTQSLEIVKTVSMQKQVLGYEVEASIFRFFDNTLVDFSAGAKNQEPIQLAVRTTLEHGVLDLMAYATGTSLVGCPGYDSEELRVYADEPEQVAVTPVAAQPANQVNDQQDVDAAVVPVAPANGNDYGPPPNRDADRFEPRPRGVGPDASKRPTDPALAEPAVTSKPGDNGGSP